MTIAYLGNKHGRALVWSDERRRGVETQIVDAEVDGRVALEPRVPKVMTYDHQSVIPYQLTLQWVDKGDDAGPVVDLEAICSGGRSDK